MSYVSYKIKPEIDYILSLFAAEDDRTKTRALERTIKDAWKARYPNKPLPEPPKNQESKPSATVSEAAQQAEIARKVALEASRLGGEDKFRWMFSKRCTEQGIKSRPLTPAEIEFFLEMREGAVNMQAAEQAKATNAVTEKPKTEPTQEKTLEEIMALFED